MILIEISLALIALVFGAQLLAQSKKENLDKLYKYLAWFVILMGFLTLAGAGVKSLLVLNRMRNGGGKIRKEIMMHRREMNSMGNGMMWQRGMCNGNNCCGWMNCCSGMNNNCCDGGMMQQCPENNNMKDGNGAMTGGSGMKMGPNCCMDSAKRKK